MTDVTAQAFRAAATQQSVEARALAKTVERGHTYLLKGDRHHVVLLLNLYADLLLAAAEQREQVDILQGSVVGQSDFIRQMGREHAQQIATLTAEREALKAERDGWHQSADYRGASIDALEEMLSTLKAERDTARATLAKVREVLLDAGIVNDSSAYELRDMLLDTMVEALLDAPTRPK